MLIDAKSLRDKTMLKQIPNNKPGYYKWWAREEDIIFLFNKLGFEFVDYKQDIETNNGFFCIYVGVAIKGSIRDRLDWHIKRTF